MPGKVKTQKKRIQYNRDDVQRAVDAVTSRSMSVRKASAMFAVPKSTVADRVNQRYGSDPRLGRPAALPDTIENKIVDTVKAAAKKGIGISRRQLLTRTGDLCRRYRVTPFKNVAPSNQWWEGVKKRHPELSIRRPEKLAASRARMLNPTVVSKYMASLGELIASLNLSNKPQSIWNYDETGRSFEHSPVRVIAEKSSKNVVGRTGNNRTNVSIMACVNAAGRSMSPMFVVKGKTNLSIHGFNTAAAPSGTKWTHQDNGWMTDKIGEEWFRDVFLRECGDERPQILILDGHSSHESLAILELAKENNVSILCLPPHTTHILQPLDRSVFGPFSTAYNTACSDYLGQNPLNTVTKWSFPGLVKTAWDTSFTHKNIVSGFRACGVFPFNPTAISQESFAPSQPSDRPTSTVTSDQISLSPRIPVSTSPEASTDGAVPLETTTTTAERSLPVIPCIPLSISSEASTALPTTITSQISVGLTPSIPLSLVHEESVATLTVDTAKPTIPSVNGQVQLSFESLPDIDHPELLISLLSSDQLELGTCMDSDSVWNNDIEN
ncbi:uncharacterized protein LOC110440970 [Mizuhopecten yessoensis]|uniref:uncharacterized protein LOC110440970 n=1 Tax=Mizuhopecten yessoensis TaxID=6573 RepID=UPI000B45E555|nr:uncharacterized protein LOC110440970 [Mizuhopecten yessoensis]